MIIDEITRDDVITVLELVQATCALNDDCCLSCPMQITINIMNVCSRMFRKDGNLSRSGVIRMIRVSELLKCSANYLNRVVIMDHGNLYPFNNKTMPELDKYAWRVVNSFYIETIYFEDKMNCESAIKVKQTMFI